MAAYQDDDLTWIGLPACDQVREGAPAPIGALFVAALVKNREILFPANHGDSDRDFLLLYLCQPESVVGATRFVEDRVVYLCSADDLGALPRISLSRSTAN